MSVIEQVEVASSQAIDKPKQAPKAFVACGALLLAASAALPWWHTLNAPEPGYVKLLRLVVFAAAVLMGISVFRERLRSTAVLAAVAICLIAPLAIPEIVTTCDAPRIDTVMREWNQAYWLTLTVRQDEQFSYIPWSDPTSKTIPDSLSNSYTLLEGIEATASFALSGWYLCWIDAALFLIMMGYYYGPDARRLLHRRRVVIAVAAVAFVVLIHARLLMASYYWNTGRIQAAEGNYAAALKDELAVVRWDKRWDSDIVYHAEIGRIDAALGLTNTPDYWAMLADSYTRSKNYAAAYAVYRDHVTDNPANAAMRWRYVDAMMHMAVVNFNYNRYGLACDNCRAALSIDPNDVQAYYYLGIFQNKAGDYAGAVQTWKELIKLNEGVGLYRLEPVCSHFYRKSITSRAWIFLGWSYYQLHDYQSALACRRNAELQSDSKYEPVDD